MNGASPEATEPTLPFAHGYAPTVARRSVAPEVEIEPLGIGGRRTVEPQELAAAAPPPPEAGLVERHRRPGGVEVVHRLRKPDLEREPPIVQQFGHVRRRRTGRAAAVTGPEVDERDPVALPETVLCQRKRNALTPVGVSAMSWTSNRKSSGFTAAPLLPIPMNVSRQENGFAPTTASNETATS